MNEDLINEDLINEVRNTWISSLFILGGSVLFLVGAIVGVATAYQAYNRVLAQNS